jgi:hypothetical protein
MLYLLDASEEVGLELNSKGKTQNKGIREKGTEENIWT